MSSRVPFKLHCQSAICQWLIIKKKNTDCRRLDNLTIDDYDYYSRGLVERVRSSISSTFESQRKEKKPVTIFSPKHKEISAATAKKVPTSAGTRRSWMTTSFPSRVSCVCQARKPFGYCCTRRVSMRFYKNKTHDGASLRERGRVDSHSR